MARIIEITAIDKPELIMFAGLTEPQLRNRLEPEQGLFIAESPKVIELALSGGCKPLALLMERKHITGQGSVIIAKCGDIPVYTGDREILAQLTGYKLTRGILCAMHRPPSRTVEMICNGARRLAVLDGITDAMNVGAIFRCAAALNIDGVLVADSCCDPLCRRSVRVSMGTIFQVPWAHISSICQLREQNFKLAALALSDMAIDIEAPELLAEQRLALVFGTEGYGLSDSTLARCDYMVQIPMAHGVDSLNVAAASAIAFWQLRVRR